MFDYSKLKGLIKEKNISYGEIAADIGMSLWSFSRKINGYGEFRPSEIYGIVVKLGINLEFIGLYFFTLEIAKTQDESCENAEGGQP